MPFLTEMVPSAQEPDTTYVPEELMIRSVPSILKPFPDVALIPESVKTSFTEPARSYSWEARAGRGPVMIRRAAARSAVIRNVFFIFSPDAARTKIRRAAFP